MYCKTISTDNRVINQWLEVEIKLHEIDFFKCICYLFIDNVLNLQMPNNISYVKHSSSVQINATCNRMAFK